MREHFTLPDVPGSPERMQKSAAFYETFIEAGIQEAQREMREIDDATARAIPLVLGRALGRASALAEFARSGQGSYEALRDEYLPLYNDPSTPDTVRSWIDWFGTYLLNHFGTGSGRQFMNEHLPPKLSQVLVRTEVTLGDHAYEVHVPADREQAAIDDLTAMLRLLDLDKDEALQAFLRLPDVDALSGNVMESFHESYVGSFPSVEAALRGLVELDDWENDLQSFAAERGLLPSAVSINYGVIESQTREIYDLVQHGGAIHAFTK